MFVKLHWLYTKDAVVFNADEISYFGKGGGATWVLTKDGKEHQVSESPDEILDLLREKL